jgi:hypothetical protein
MRVARGAVLMIVRRRIRSDQLDEKPRFDPSKTI